MKKKHKKYIMQNIDKRSVDEIAEHLGKPCEWSREKEFLKYDKRKDRFIIY